MLYTGVWEATFLEQDLKTSFFLGGIQSQQTAARIWSSPQNAQGLLPLARRSANGHQQAVPDRLVKSRPKKVP